MPINASLFGHIQNDAFLSGTYKLEGNFFSKTTEYLKNYLENSINEPVNANYTRLLKDLNYLVLIEQRLPQTPATPLAKDIVQDIKNLQIGERLLIPGGWSERDMGHAMIYEFVRTDDGYHFTVYNSGDGLRYHEKKSTTEKELYNPTKKWSIPLLSPGKSTEELIHFIQRLLIANTKPGFNQLTMSSQRLYEELLPSIVYAGGKEINASTQIPDFGYTAGQLSGTCAQRSIHQMLKLSSHSLQEYQGFIFKFKMHALIEYSSACFAGSEPFNAAVVEQIQLAIENNLKILNTESSLFNEQQTETYLAQLVHLKTALSAVSFPEQNNAPGEVAYPQCTLNAPPLIPKPAISSNFNYNLPQDRLISFNDNNFLQHLELHVANIKNLSDYAEQYNYLESLLLALPISPSGKLDMTPYKNLLATAQYQRFDSFLRMLQGSITKLQKNWLNKNQVTKVNTLALSAASLQTDIFNARNLLTGVPSYADFTNLTLQSLIANHQRNPFLATNDPKLDARLQELQQRYKGYPNKNRETHIQYLNALVKTNPDLKEELEGLYVAQYGADNTPIHKKLRAEGLQALYMISEHLAQDDLNSPKVLNSRYQPLIDKIKTHLNYEAHTRKSLNLFFVAEYSENPTIKFLILNDVFRVDTPLYPTFIPFQALSKKITKSKYNLPVSPAKEALERDVPEYSAYHAPIISRTANHIQLHPDALKTEATRPITQKDILARDYHHLRSNPEIQIALTLDYFKQNIENLASESDRLYVEANLFQPGLLLKYVNKQGLSQIDSFITIGLRFYTHSGQHTTESVFFLRLNFLISNYLVLAGNQANGIKRLSSLQEDIKVQLQTNTNPQIVYVLHHYLFLVTLGKLAHADNTEDFTLALHAYLYIQSHSPSTSFEDATDRTELSCAIAHFQTMLQKRNLDRPVRCKALIEQVTKGSNHRLNGLIMTGQFPVYSFTDDAHNAVYKFNAILGKLFQNDLALSGIPLDIKNHPLIKHLQLNNESQCLMSNKEEYLFLLHDPREAKIYRVPIQILVVQQKWVVDGVSEYYELQRLSARHAAIKKTFGCPVAHSLPQVLTDARMNFWKSVDSVNKGILVQNNSPRYLLNGSTLFVLDEKGFSTQTELSPLDAAWAPLLNSFESSQFIVHHKTPNGGSIELPRYGLHFTRELNTLRLTETNEEIVSCPPPIPKTAGIVLAKGNHQRFVVPVARFYATDVNATVSDVYPVVHDINGDIPQRLLQTNLQYRHNPTLWNYQDSEHYVSFRLKNGIPQADTTAEALYLAYIYLAIHQPQKAWAVLGNCQTRLGGLTGTAEELKYCMWICTDLPFILSNDEKAKKAIRKTPPYIACKLKTLSILCDYLSQDHQIHLPTSTTEAQTSNDLWAAIEHDEARQFLKALPETIYQNFTRYQAVRRHIDASYTLSSTERRRLLNHYQQQQLDDNEPKGALGYEWMLLTLESLQQEQETLLAYLRINPLSATDQDRLQYINKQLETLKPVVARSSALILKSINLKLEANPDIKKNHLSAESQNKLAEWKDKLPGNRCQEVELNAAVAALSSNISEDDLITYFPAYLQIAIDPSAANVDRSKALIDFCIQTLIAERHRSWENQTKNRMLFCNLLYRITHIRPQFIQAHYNFYQLIAQFRMSWVPELKVYEAVDVYKHILATPSAILLPKKAYVRAPAAPPLSTYVPLVESMIKDSSLASLIKQYELLQTQYEETYQRLTKELSTNLEKTRQLEQLAGKKQLDLERQQIELAKQLLENKHALAEMLMMTEATQLRVTAAIEQTWLQALQLANEGPADKQQARSWKIDRESKKRATLNKADLYRLYTQNDLNYTAEQTGLSLDKAQLLHGLIHDGLVHGIQLKMLNSIQDSINKAQSSRDTQSLVLGLDLFAKESIPGLETPAIVLLQHEDDNIAVLRPRQVSALQNLLTHTEGNFKEIVEKIIPGGGKSKVILPIVAEHKANQTNLVIIEVPQALLATNHVDLNRTSQRLFGKSAFRFEFNRESNCSSMRLEQIYNQFIEIKNNRGYLVTTGESMQSLELKYIEILLQEENEHSAEWEKQVFWADQLVTLIHNHGDVIIDEVHQGLWIKKKLNYTIGNPKLLSQQTIQNTIALFQYIDTEVIKKAPDFDENYDWIPFQKELASKLLTEADSPLHAFVTNAYKKYGQDVSKELLSYLLNAEDATYPKAILDASTEIKIAFGFFKQQISSLLPKTLIRRLDEKYGASKKEDITPIERTLAIPFLANTIPNERSLFSTLESINNSCQMMLIKGISKELLKEKMSLWLAVARQELFKTPNLRHIDNTTTARGVEVLCTKIGLKLSQLKLDDEEQLDKLHAHLKNDRPLIFEILEQQTLKLIPQDGEIIHSDSFNHVDMYHSTQGVSGTPTPNTLHQRLKYDQTSSLGSDGYIVELINSKDTPISYVDYKNAEQFITHILDHCTAPQKCRAIIDIRAAFQGVDNLTVARALVSYISTHQAQFSHPIKQVLYFDDQQILCALDVNKPGSKPIQLKSSDLNEINRLLGSTPEERFTYYDQARTLGTDITQYDEAHALVLVDEKTPQQAFLQGDMRMRGLRLKQTLELVVPEKLKTLSRAELIKKFSKTDDKTMLEDTPFAVTGQMTNLIRRTCLDEIQKIPASNAKAKAKLTQALKTFFVQTPSNDYFELYGALSKKQATEKIFTDHKERLIALWSKTYEAANIPLSAQEITHIRKQLDAIITNALPYCAKEYEHNTNNALGVEIEVQKEVLREVMVQVATINESFSAELKEHPPVDWYYCQLSSYSQPEYLNSVSIPINDIGAPLANKAIAFSPELRLSKSYAKTHRTQQHVLDGFLKPVSAIWYYFSSGILHAMILTPQDVSDLQGRISTTLDHWITTTEDTVLYGTRPVDMLENIHYQTIKEQIRFFNGEFNSLLHSETPLAWLNEHAGEKLDFFEQYILPYRPRAISKFQELKMALLQANNEGYSYILDHPFEDLRECNWLALFPETSPIQETAYKKLALAFHVIYCKFQEYGYEEVDLNRNQQPFNIPINSLGFVEAHLSYLKTLDSLLKYLLEKSEMKSSGTLNDENKALLEECLGQPLGDFYKQYQISPSSTFDSAQGKCCLIDMVEHVQAHRFLDATKQIAAIYLNLSRVADTMEVQLKLLKNVYSVDIVIGNIIDIGPKAPEVVDEILVVDELLLTSSFDLTRIEQFAHHCTTEAQQLSLLTKGTITITTVRNLLKREGLSNKVLLAILLHANQENLLHVYNTADAEIRKAIYAHYLFDASLLLEILDANEVKKSELYKEIEEAELLKLLKRTNPKQINPKVLIAISSKQRYSAAVLLAAMLHNESNDQVVTQALDHQACTPSILQSYIKNKSPHIGLESLKNIIFRAYLNGVNAYATPDWQDCCIEALAELVKLQTANKAHNPSTPDVIRDVVKLMQPVELRSKPQFAIRIFTVLKKRIIEKLNYTELLQKASEAQLALFIAHDNTGNLSNDQLMQLAIRCTTAEQIDLLIERPDLSDLLRLSLLTLLSRYLSTAQIQKLVQTCSSDSVLIAAYQHAMSTPAVRESIYAHAYFSSKTLKALLDTNQINEEELITLLPQAQFIIDSDVLLKISKKFPDSQRLVDITLVHPKANKDVINQILNNHTCTVDTFLNILKQTNVKINAVLLVAMTKKTLNALAIALPQDVPKWENCLIELLSYFKVINAMPQMVALLQQTQIGLRVALRILNVFPPEIIRQCAIPVGQILLQANEEQLKQLLHKDFTEGLDEWTLLELSKRCTTEELITIFLEGSGFSEKVLHTILAQNVVTSTHLVTILEYANLTQPIFDAICLHNKVNKPVRARIYSHPLTQPLSLRAVLKPNEGIHADEIESLLIQRNAAVDSQVLQHIAASFIENAAILTALLVHPDSTEDLRTAMFNHPLFSIDLAQDLQSKNKVLSLTVLKELAAIVFKESLQQTTIAKKWQLVFQAMMYSMAQQKISDELIALITDKESINEQFGLTILENLGSAVLHKLPIKRMVECAAPNQLYLFLELKSLTILNEEESLALLQRCSSSASLTALMQKPNMTDTFELKTLEKITLDADHLLMLLMQYPISYRVLYRIYTHNKANDAVRKDVCRHLSFTSAIMESLLHDGKLQASSMLYLLDKPNQAVNNDVLSTALVYFAQNPRVLHAISAHPSADTYLLIDLAQKAFDLYLLTTATENKLILEECLISTIKKIHALNNTKQIKELIQKNSTLIPPHLGLVILSLFGPALLPHLPLNKMIEIAEDKESLDLLVRAKDLSESSLKLLARKTLSAEQINVLLSRTDMTSSIADLLFANPHYDGTVHNWPWLEQEQLIKFLSTPHSVMNVHQIKQLTNNAKAQWLANLNEQQRHMQQEAMSSKKPEQLLDAALEKLRIKALSHTIKSLTKPSYQAPARTAMVLYKTLSHYKSQLISNPEQTLPPIIKAINNAKPVLEVHRGYKQVFLDILNAVLNLVTLGLKAYTTKSWRFFSANTDSINVLDNLNECIDQFSPKQKPGLE